MAIEMTQPVGSADRFPADTVAYAPGWAPAVLTERGSAMCKLIAFGDAFEALSLADRAYFAYRLSELLVEACEAETALR